MRRYKDRAVLSLNPILDIMFLEDNYDSTPFPSLKNKASNKKANSMKDLGK